MSIVIDGQMPAAWSMLMTVIVDFRTNSHDSSSNSKLVKRLDNVSSLPRRYIARSQRYCASQAGDNF